MCRRILFTSTPVSVRARVAERFGPQRVFYGWYIALAGGFSNFLVVGIVIFGFGVLYKPMREELGWSMAVITAGVSIRSFEQGFMSPLTGYLVDRLGPRRMALTGVTILTMGLLLFSQAHEVWVYLLSALIISMGQSLGAFTPFSACIVQWFDKKRGRAMGLMNSGNGLGYLAAPIIAGLVSVMGWRSTLVACAAVIFCFGIPLATVIRGRPEDYGYLPDGEPVDGGQAGGGAVTRPPASGFAVAEAIRVPAFYLIALTNAVSGAMRITWATLQIPHLQDVGFSDAATGFIVAGYGLLQVGLRFAAGWSADAIGRRRLLILAHIFQGIGLLFFASLSADNWWLLIGYALIFAPSDAAWVVISQTIVADYFGVRRFATLRGLLQMLALPLGLVAPVFGGWMFDQTDSYRVVFYIHAFTMASGAIWLLLIRRPMWRDLEQQSPTDSVAAGAG